MKRLIEQESCEHGKWGECRKNVQWSTLVSRPCPGGTSREVTVDFEAARQYADGLAISRTTVEGIVRAALGGGR